MNRKWLLLGLLILLSGVAWWLARNKSDSTLDRPLTDFAVPDTSRVTRIFIADKKGHTVDLVRAKDGWWLNGKYRVRQPEVTTALKTFLRIEVKSPVPKSGEEMVLRTMAGAAQKVEIYEGGDKPSRIWLIGHATKDHFGTYMVLEKPDEGRSSAPFIMGIGGFTGVLNTRFPATVDNWRSSRVYNFHDLHDLASVEVEHVGRPLASYRVENPASGAPKLTDLKGRPLPMDTVLVQASLLPYRIFDYEYIERLMKRSSRDSLLAATPNFIIRTKAREGTEKTMKLWYMAYNGDEGGFDTPRPIHDPMRMFAFVEDSLIVIVQRQYTDLMTQPAMALMP
ncbi:MAG: hypothetical protein IT226_10585 [Flavobacteriales bacterium]|nr:hypothetical protein [Flavobacteriales bacterium]